jgi:flagellar assembly factor FliW
MDVVTFPEGLIGLGAYHRFTIKKIPEQELFLQLQSLDDEYFSLVITSPFWFKPEYEFELPDRCIDQLGGAELLEVFVVVTLATNPQNISANLLGPLVISKVTGIGFQLLADDHGYTTSHKPLITAGR